MQRMIKLVLGSVVALVLWGMGPLAASAQVVRNTFAGGGGHSLSIHADGTLWATGNNSDGQLGDNTTTNKAAWVQVGTDTDWVQVAAGQNHSLGLKANGTLYAWGDNAQGQLGNGTTADASTPTAVAGGGTYTQLAAGVFHSLGLRLDGTLYAWGDNDESQLGDGTTADKAVPTAVAGTYTRIAAGFYHSLGLRPDGTLWAWGVGNSGQLGTGSTASQAVPTAVAGGHIYTQLAAGAYFSLGLRSDGRIYAWGANNLSQLGNGTITNSLVPTPVSGNKVYSQVAAGGFHGLGLRPDGVLETWGENTQGQLGTNSNVTATQPTAVTGNGTYVQVVGGRNHSLAIRADGTLYAWGRNDQGQLGDPAASIVYLPTALGAALPTRSTAAGGAFGLAIKGDGTLWSWGDNAYGQLGDGTTTARTRPLQVGTARTWVQVVAGNHHALALQANGSLWAWGDNSLGQVGNGANVGTANPNTTPVLVSAGPYVRLAAGDAYSLALQADGTLLAWGSNEAGQLGIAANAGTTTPNPTLAPVPGQYAQVAAGAAHALALQATGTLYAWGANASGQLGSTTNNGTAAPNPTPTALGTATYAQVAAGQVHSLALQADGTLLAWGSNESGQLGNTVNIGTAAANPVPAAVAGQYAQVAAGYARSLARRANGTIWAWGADDNGQLGLGTTGADVSTPTQEATQATTWTTLAAGPLSKASLVRTPSAQSFASAGLNDQGQLGDGTTTNAPRFDRVVLLSAAGPLPVTLVSFEARRTGPATVAVTWATATETSNAGFTVQKSADGTAFSALGFVAGAGTSAAAHAYTYTDGQAPGRSYYRLAQHDSDGTTTYSPVAVVEGAATKLALVPNPAHGAVQVLGLAPEATLVVYDNLGRAVRPAAATLDVAGLPAGIYLVRATAPHQAPQTVRLVVE